MSNREFESTVKSAYKDAGEFFEHCKDNGFNVVYKTNDGIKKPYTTNNIIKKLNIIEDEQRSMGSIRNSSIAKEQHKTYMMDVRRSKGVRPRSEYEQNRQQQKQVRINKLSSLLEENPNMTKTAISKEIGVSRR